MYANRIINGLALSKIASEVELDKCTLGRFERGRKANQESIKKIQMFIVAYVLIINPSFSF